MRYVVMHIQNCFHRLLPFSSVAVFVWVVFFTNKRNISINFNVLEPVQLSKQSVTESIIHQPNWLARC